MTAALSYVVVTDCGRTIARLVPHLRALRGRQELEVVIVTLPGSLEEVRASLPDDFPAVRVVAHDTIRPMGGARAAGVRAATAPIVFLGETHSFPEPGFAEAILRAAEGSWDVLVPGFQNANPENAISWSNYLMDYGSWHRTLPGGEIAGGPTWNVAYRKRVLVAHDRDLDRMLSHGDILSQAFHAAGYRTVFEPSAVIAHANLSQARWWFEQRYLAGLLVGESRRQRWAPARRLVYAAATPLIPAVLIARLRGAIDAGRSDGMGFVAIPALLVGAVFRTVGELVAYLGGAAGAAQVRMDEYELFKLDYTGLSH